jgi:hypothetical protein
VVVVDELPKGATGKNLTRAVELPVLSTGSDR